MGRWDRMGRALLQLQELPWFSGTLSWAPLALLPSCSGAAGPAPPQPNTTSPAGHRGVVVGASGIPLPGILVPSIPYLWRPYSWCLYSWRPCPWHPCLWYLYSWCPCPWCLYSWHPCPWSPCPWCPNSCCPPLCCPHPHRPRQASSCRHLGPGVPAPCILTLLSPSLFSPSLVPHVPMERGGSFGLRGSCIRSSG